jgi:hypothetical protein
MDLTASQVMRRSIMTVPKTLPLPSLEHAFLERGISDFPWLTAKSLWALFRART